MSDYLFTYVVRCSVLRLLRVVWCLRAPSVDTMPENQPPLFTCHLTHLTHLANPTLISQLMLSHS